MSENLFIDKNSSKEEKYKSLIPQIKSLITGENDFVANLANIASALYFAMDFFWVGFYIVKNNQLVLGPFHGPVACTRINFGAGVCGSAWKNKQTIIVPDVDKFPGHIACSSQTKSEIVVPATKNTNVIFVLDVDSNKLDSFNEIDEKFLGQLVDFVTENMQ